MSNKKDNADLEHLRAIQANSEIIKNSRGNETPRELKSIDNMQNSDNLEMYNESGEFSLKKRTIKP